MRDSAEKMLKSRKSKGQVEDTDPADTMDENAPKKKPASVAKAIEAMADPQKAADDAVMGEVKKTLGGAGRGRPFGKAPKAATKSGAPKFGKGLKK